MSDRDEGKVSVVETVEKAAPDKRPAFRVQFMPSAGMQSDAHNRAEGRPSDGVKETIPARAQSDNVIAGNRAALQHRKRVQRHGGGEGSAGVHAAAAHGVADGGSALPHLDSIQESFGSHDVSGIKAHVGGAAKEASESMGAQAYATGNDVAFRESPDLHTAAHEAAHIVQQRGGVSLAGGVGQAGDAYEQHADRVADAVVAGESAESLLSPMAGGTGDGGVQHAVQRAEEAGGGGGGGGDGGGDQAVDNAAREEGAVDGNAPAPESTVERPEGGGSGEGAGEEAAAHPRQAEIDADRAAIKPVASLEAYRDLVSGLQVAPTPSSKADVPFRINKLLTAMPAAEAHLKTAYGNAVGATKIQEWYRDRQAIIEGELANYQTNAESALSAIESSGEVNVAQQWDATGAMKIWDGIKPEELTTAEALAGYNIVKAFDLGSLWDEGSPEFTAAWSAAGGKEAWLSACTSQNKVAVDPPAAPGAVPGPGLSLAQAFPKSHYGFVGVSKKDDGLPGSFAAAITQFALDEGYYSSGKMILGVASSGALSALIDRGAIGKPSIFYLLVFNENTYDPADRVFGHLADPDDPSQPGSSLELQVDGMPQSEFLSGTIIS